MRNRPIKLTSLFNSLFAQPGSASLKPEIIDAVSLYNTKDHQHVLQEWMKNTLNKNIIVDSEGRNILHIAAMTGKHMLIRYFIKKGLHVNSLTLDSDTPLISAMKAYIDATNENNIDLKNKIMLGMKELIAAGAKNLPEQVGVPKTALSVAACSECIELVELLLNAKFNVNECDFFSPLWYLTSNRNLNSISAESKAIIKLLKQHGAVAIPTSHPVHSRIAEMMDTQNARDLADTLANRAVREAEEKTPQKPGK